VEVSVLGHYVVLEFNQLLKDLVSFIDHDLTFTKARIRDILTKMAGASISASQKDPFWKEWTIAFDLNFCIYACMYQGRI